MLFGHTVVLASVLVATFASSEHQDDNDENRRRFQKRIKGTIDVLAGASRPLSQISFETGLQTIFQRNFVKDITAAASFYRESVNKGTPWKKGSDRYNASVLIHGELHGTLENILSSAGKSHKALQHETFKEYSTTITVPAKHLVDEMHFVTNPDVTKTEQLLRKFKLMCENVAQAPDRLLRIIVEWFVDRCPDALSHRAAKIYAFVDGLVNRSIIILYGSGMRDTSSEDEVRARQKTLVLRLLSTSDHARRRTFDFLRHQFRYFGATKTMADLTDLLDEAISMAPYGPNKTCALDEIVVGENFVREPATRALSIIDQDTPLLASVGTFCYITFYDDPAIIQRYLKELQDSVDTIHREIPRKLEARLAHYWPEVALSRAILYVEQPFPAPVTYNVRAKYTQEMLDLYGPDEATRHTVVLAPKEYEDNDQWHTWTSPLAENKTVKVTTPNYHLLLKRNVEDDRVNSWLLPKSANESERDIQRILDNLKNEQRFWPKAPLSNVFKEMVARSPVFSHHLNDTIKAVVVVREYYFWHLPAPPRYGAASAPQATAKSVQNVESGSKHLHELVQLQVRKENHLFDGDYEQIYIIVMT